MTRKVKSLQLRVTSLGNLLVFLWMLFIPTQLGRHFWPDWSHVMGLRVDYLAPTIYFLDLVWVLMVGRIFNFKFLIFNQINRIFNFKFLIILLFVIINIFVAGNRWEAGYRWIRIFQWIITFKIILNNKRLFREMLMRVLPFWIVGEGLLSVAQVVNGGSINGIFYWLGERRFSYISLGVAQISWLGEGLIRAYGTFSHPNSLAGFMLISLVMYMRYQNFKLQITNYELLRKIFRWVVVFCGLLGLFLAGSRTIWIILIGLVISYQLRVTSWKKRLGTMLIMSGVIILILGLMSNDYRISDFVGGWDSDGLIKRGALMTASLKMFKDNPLFGVGAGNFLVKLPDYQKNSGVFWLQPVHNIVFLFVSEFGIVGLILLVSITNYELRITNLRRRIKNSLVILGIILITGMFDHYWLTLPQNTWLLAVVLGII